MIGVLLDLVCCRYAEAAPLLENIFYVREKLLTISNLHVLQCLCELVATLEAVNKKEVAFGYVKVAMKSFELVKGAIGIHQNRRFPFVHGGSLIGVRFIF